MGTKLIKKVYLADQSISDKHPLAEIISACKGYSLNTIQGDDISNQLKKSDDSPIALLNIPAGDTDSWLTKGKEILAQHDLPLVFVVEEMSEGLFGRINDISPYGFVLKDCSKFTLLQTLDTAFQLFQNRSQQPSTQAHGELNTLATKFSKIAGQQLFNQVCRHLVETLNMDFAFVGELNDTRDQISIYTIFGDGEFRKPFTYDLSGTPCDDVKNQETCSIQSGVQDLYPDDQLLTDWDIEGYIGVPLISSDKDVLGIAVLLNKEPIQDTNHCQQILQIYSDRVSTEMERIQAEKSLLEREQQLRSINKNITEGIYRSTPNAGLVYINKAFSDMFGYDSREELINLEGPEMYATEERREEIRKLEEEHGYIKNEEVEFKRKDGSTFWALMSGSIVYDEDGNVKYYDGSVLDITERKKTQEQNKRLLEAIKQSPVSIIITDTEGKIQYVNPQYVIQSGKSKESVLDTVPDVMDEETQPEEIQSSLWETLQNGQVWKGTIKNEKDDTYYWEEATISPVFGNDGDIINYIIICEDITQRKKQKEQLEQSVKEKEILLAEIHHRVKNNLAVISGLLELQKFKTSDSVLKDVLKNTSNRIQSIANVHELLYRTEDFSNIELQSQIKKLCQGISNSYSQKSQSISFEINASDVQLNANQAITFGLLLNELINNSFKHAFPESMEKGKIRIELSEDGNNINLKYSDNGVGFPTNTPNEETIDSLGLTLIDTLAKQLEVSEKEIQNKNGFTFEMTFKKIEDEHLENMMNHV